MSMPRSPRGVDSITFGTIIPFGSITSRVSLIHFGSFGLKMLPIFTPFNIRNDLSLFSYTERVRLSAETECAEDPCFCKAMYHYDSTCNIQTKEYKTLI